MLSKLKPKLEGFEKTIGRLFSWAPPNLFSIFTFLFSIPAFYFLSKANYKEGLLFVILSSLCDLIDGAVARTTKRESKFGAFLDSNMDRLAEGMFYWGLANSGHNLAFPALIFSYMVSYARAKYENVSRGIFERGERIIVLVLGLATGKIDLALAVIAVGAAFTYLQRFLSAMKGLQ